MSFKLAVAVTLYASTFFLGASAAPRSLVDWLNPNSTCSQIKNALSSSSALCWPGTAEDVGKILQILAATNTSFAVKGGGHASNPGFSSTTGVHISMTRFSEVTYHPESSTADIGAGNVWDTVYNVLEEQGVMVVGGRVTGVGVAGFTLGGGYSWLTNQYGLTIDTVVAFELVLPNGTVTTVTESSNPDLMFALKGGYNNFGIVTKFTLKTFAQGQVWGGLLTFTENVIPQVTAAAANFAANVTDPKAGIITTYNFLLGEPGVSQILFYDGEEPPAGIFDEFLAIPHFTEDIKTRSFSSLVQASPSNATSGTRGIFNTVSLLEYTPELLDTIVNETTYWGSTLQWSSGTFISYDVEPFRPSLFSQGSTSTSAYPPSRAQPLLPLNLYFAYTDALQDQRFYDAIRQTAATIKAKAVSLGQAVADAPMYGNYAIFSTPLETIYGEQLPRLRSIKQRYDPGNVMALAGGWKI
ncbi:FAD dependent oxidoreductase [Gloeophyllum trabeum ATCC 11539]|uniref:FAD dependent oxidoreductase n=1 Tax=Gloeophyllum trabeum (strain ATCC 11539 / FP-39264 / Madison 617) TaxID=670483 RepID=S7PSK8_GLOTA|nr:FAD dependent oxidoreductase [Gloeophyllum trabeum ATCC 11539]EPQ50806.1 FAD dependent oxidoreductase [Gloeophyllum trabeum ATCC 11539]